MSTVNTIKIDVEDNHLILTGLIQGLKFKLLVTFCMYKIKQMGHLVPWLTLQKKQKNMVISCSISLYKHIAFKSGIANMETQLLWITYIFWFFKWFQLLLLRQRDGEEICVKSVIILYDFPLNVGIWEAETSVPLSTVAKQTLITHTHTHAYIHKHTVRRQGVGVYNKEIPLVFEQYGTQSVFILLLSGSL